MAPHTINLITRWRWVVNLPPWAASPRQKPRATHCVGA